jgi:hypothetical protein
MIDKFKRHWLVSLISLCAGVAAVTWTVALQVLVAPRDFEISSLKGEIDRLKAGPIARADKTVSRAGITVLEDTGVNEGNGVTSSDGGCTVKVIKVFGDEITLSVVVDIAKPQIFERVRAGDRLPVVAAAGKYFVDIHRIRGNIVDLAIFKT